MLAQSKSTREMRLHAGSDEMVQAFYACFLFCALLLLPTLFFTLERVGRRLVDVFSHHNLMLRFSITCIYQLDD